MTGKENGWLLVGLLSLAVWAFTGDCASAQAPDWETYMEAATKAYREGRYAEAEKQIQAALKEAAGVFHGFLPTPSFSLTLRGFRASAFARNAYR